MSCSEQEGNRFAGETAEPHWNSLTRPSGHPLSDFCDQLRNKDGVQRRWGTCTSLTAIHGGATCRLSARRVPGFSTTQVSESMIMRPVSQPFRGQLVQNSVAIMGSPISWSTPPVLGS